MSRERHENRRLTNTLTKRIPSFPLARDFKTLTAPFHDNATDVATLCESSFDKWKLDGVGFSILYPNLRSKFQVILVSEKRKRTSI